MNAADKQSAKTGGRANIWAIGGCKGGIGKSFVTSNFGIILGAMGHRTLLVDLDLGGANLHTWLGVPMPQMTLSDFLSSKKTPLEDLIVDTGLPHLRLLNGASDVLGIANLKHAQKQKLLRAIGRLDYDYILLDLGGGTSYNTVDFFLLADQGVIVVVPEPVAVENAYRFIKSAFFRNLRHHATSKSIRKWVTNIIERDGVKDLRAPIDLVDKIEREDPETGQRLREAVARFHPKIVVNQTREKRDQDIGTVMSKASSRFFGIGAQAVGCIPYDESVWRSVRARRPIAKTFPKGPVCAQLTRIVEMVMAANEVSDKHEDGSDSLF